MDFRKLYGYGGYSKKVKNDFLTLNPPFTEKFIKTDYAKLVREDSEIVWTIDQDILKCKEDSENEKRKLEFLSPLFPKDSKSAFRWRVKFHPYGNTENSKHSSIYLYSEWKKIKKPVNTTAQCTLKTGDCSISKKLVCDFVNNDHKGWSKFMLSSKLLSEIEIPMEINLKVSAQYEAFCCQTSNFSSEQNLLQNYSRLLKDGTFSDVIIYTERDKMEFKVHRNILAARSNVFSAMLTHGTKENTTGRIVISDISGPIIKSMLDFIYSCEVELSDVDETIDLLKASDKYEVMDLKSQCEENLTFALNESNACKILLVTDMLNLHDLKTLTLQYISKNKSKFVHSSMFDDILKENPKLLVEIVTKFCSEAKNESISEDESTVEEKDESTSEKEDECTSEEDEPRFSASEVDDDDDRISDLDYEW